MKKIFSEILLILITLSFACNNNSGTTPPKIILGQDACDNCFMIINESKFAATIWLNNGEAKRFDDIGCMIFYRIKNENKIKNIWVYDFNKGTPLPANDAFFVKSSAQVTPMGSGLVAFSSENSAEHFAKKQNSLVIDFKTLINQQLYNGE